MCKLATVNRLEQAAAQVMDCELDELREEKYDYYGLKVYSYARLEYAIGTDEECDKAATEYIKQSLWAFNSDFVASHTKAGATNGMVKAIKALQVACESSNDDIESLIEDLDEFIEDAIGADGRGHFLSSYDGNEEEIKVNGEYCYAYRLN
jgi:hypothetical protein